MTEEKEIEKSESSRSTFNDADKIVEDTSGFKKECIIEAEGNLPEDAAPESVIKPTEITVEKTEEDVTDVSTEEIVDNSMKKEDIDKIDAEAKEYLEKHSKEAEIDWDKIEFVGCRISEPFSASLQGISPNISVKMPYWSALST